jgi:hypothetical protein
VNSGNVSWTCESSTNGVTTSGSKLENSGNGQPLVVGNSRMAIVNSGKGEPLVVGRIQEMAIVNSEKVGNHTSGSKLENSEFPESCYH